MKLVAGVSVTWGRSSSDGRVTQLSTSTRTAPWADRRTPTNLIVVRWSPIYKNGRQPKLGHFGTAVTSGICIT